MDRLRHLLHLPVLSTMVSALRGYLEDFLSFCCVWDGGQTCVSCALTTCRLSVYLCVGKDGRCGQKGQTFGGIAEPQGLAQSWVAAQQTEVSGESLATVETSLNQVQKQAEAEGCRVGQGDGAAWWSPWNKKANSAGDSSSAVWAMPGEVLGSLSFLIVKQAW